jgi:hypothetical protein
MTQCGIRRRERHERELAAGKRTPPTARYAPTMVELRKTSLGIAAPE